MKLLHLVVLVLCCWVVSLGGLSALQSQCRGASRTGNDCGRIYRFSWWAMAYEFVVLAGLCGALISNTAHRTMNSWVGLFSIASVLFIYGSDEFYSAQGLPTFSQGAAASRARVTTAGFLMTAIGNLLITFLVGLEDDCADCAERQARRTRQLPSTPMMPAPVKDITYAAATTTFVTPADSDTAQGSAPDTTHAPHPPQPSHPAPTPTSYPPGATTSSTTPPATSAPAPAPAYPMTFASHYQGRPTSMYPVTMAAPYRGAAGTQLPYPTGPGSQGGYPVIVAGSLPIQASATPSATITEAAPDAPMPPRSPTSGSLSSRRGAAGGKPNMPTIHYTIPAAANASTSSSSSSRVPDTTPPRDTTIDLSPEQVQKAGSKLSSAAAARGPEAV